MKGVLKLTGCNAGTPIYVRCDLITSWAEWRYSGDSGSKVGTCIYCVGNDIRYPSVVVVETVAEVARLYAEATQ